MSVDPQPNENTIERAGTPAPPRRRRFQFSLATLLGFTMVVACLLSVWAVFHAAAGRLQVSDPKMIYARRVSTLADRTWCWRVYVPREPKLRVCVSTDQIPEEVFPAPNWGQVLAPGEHVISASADLLPGNWWRFHFDVDKNGETGWDMPALKQETYERGALLTRQEAISPHSPLVLLRGRELRPTKGIPEGKAASRPCNGLMIWIEPQK